MRIARIAAVLACFFLATAAYGQQIIVISPPDTPAVDGPSPTLEEYEVVLEGFKKVTDACFDPEKWKNVELTHKETGEKKKFVDLSPIEQKTLMLNFAGEATRRLGFMKKAWDDELKGFDKPDHKLVEPPMPANEKQKAAQKKDVEGYNAQLTKMRKEFAVKYEKFAEDYMKEFKIGEKEAKHTLDGIRKVHDQDKLIERKKEK